MQNLLPTVRPTARRLFSSSASAAARKKSVGKGGNDPMDVMLMGNEFDFPLTRSTIMKVEKRREVLHYLRLEEYQFKDLVAFRKRFLKPLPSQFIKVRYQHYQGESHPGDRKVVISFSTADLHLSTDAARHKFKLLAGPRWDSDKDEVKIACEMFPTDKMNEKWCSDTLDSMIKEAEDTTDLMADIPLDDRPTLARLRKSGKKHYVSLKDFPSEWLPREVEVEVAAGSVGGVEVPSAGVGSQGGAVLGGATAAP